MSTNEPKEAAAKARTKRKARVNHAKTINELQLFCRVSIDVLTRLHVAQPTEGLTAQLMVYQEIAAKLEGNRK